MARGDVTTVITANAAAGDTTDRQPAAGVEELLLHVGDASSEGAAPDKTTAIRVDWIDGTNNDIAMLNGNSGDHATVWFRMKMVADNTNFFRIVHVGGTTADYGFAIIAIG